MKVKVSKSHDRITLNAEMPGPNGPMKFGLRWNRYSESVSVTKSFEPHVQAFAKAMNTIYKASSDNLGDRIDAFAARLQPCNTIEEVVAILNSPLGQTSAKPAPAKPADYDSMTPGQKAAYTKRMKAQASA